MSEPKPEEGELAEVGRYQRRSDAEERGLVLLAMGIDHWVLRRDGTNVLCVEAHNRGAALRELENFDAERATAPQAKFEFEPVEKSNLSLFVFAWVMAVFFLAQQLAPRWWMDAGDATSDAVTRGEWWRAITALTLHADVEHIAANLVTGLVYSAFLVRLLGTGVAWSAIVLSGVLGNLANAWLYRREPHASIGASTAVFGALGILVAWQVGVRLIAVRKVRAWELVVPIGAGLALLGYLGVGDAKSRVDFMAHFFGFVAGALLGAVVAVFRLEKRTPRAWQRALAALAPALPVFAWVLAVFHVTRS